MRAALWCAVALIVVGATGCSASSHDFDAVVQGIEQKYSVHAQQMPMMGFISLCARAKTRGGVRDMRIAQFDHLVDVNPSDLSLLLQSKLGDAWQPFVSSRQLQDGKAGDDSIIYVQPNGDSMRMLVMDYDHGELDLVRMELNGTALAQWMHRPQAGAGSTMFQHKDRKTD